MTIDTGPAKIGLVEKFHSMQGEGRNRGRNAIFVRLSGCNLACNFSDDPDDNPVPCDTPWLNANEKCTVDEIVEWAVDQLEEHPANYPLEDAPMMVFTGGEPTMNPQFGSLVERANKEGFYTAVETNGTIYKEEMDKLHWITVSPKTRVPQGNPVHGDPLTDPDPDPKVLELMRDRMDHGLKGGEYRWVITGMEANKPPYWPADRHYVSPAVNSDGSGTSHYDGFPGFVEGAVERCTEIIQTDSRWRISFQSHKFVGAR